MVVHQRSDESSNPARKIPQSVVTRYVLIDDHHCIFVVNVCRMTSKGKSIEIVRGVIVMLSSYDDCVEEHFLLWILIYK